MPALVYRASWERLQAPKHFQFVTQPQAINIIESLLCCFGTPYMTTNESEKAIHRTRHSFAGLQSFWKNVKTFLIEAGPTAANWSQVATFILLFIGYFATVRPTFQKEQLAEEVARLELERGGITEDLARYQADIMESQRRLTELEATEQSLKLQISELRDQRNLAQSQAAELIMDNSYLKRDSPLEIQLLHQRLEECERREIQINDSNNPAANGTSN